MSRYNPMPRYARAIAIAAVAYIGRAAQAQAQQAEPVQYVVRVPEPKTHYLEVEATFPTAGRPAVDLMMAVWTPGSYLVREFARHVERVTARDPSGRPLATLKTRKNRWRVSTGGAARVVVAYRVYANEPHPRTNWVEADFALVNGAPTYITLVDRTPRPHEVQFELPPGWSRTVTSLPRASDGRPDHYRAPDYDILVDSPILAGNPTVHEFAVDGVPHALVNIGETETWDGARSARDVEKIVRAAREMWGALPYERYYFFNFLVESEDGIEHKGSTVLFADRWSTRTASGYHSWLSLVSHEFFHAWNVKRLRPVELGPFDYENEVYTRSLWVAEGLSDYYAWMLVRRAGLGTPEETLADASKAIATLQDAPGRLVQPLEQASFDAWIKQYRPDENSPNVSVSYYTKGSIVGLLLDAAIRQRTAGAKSLDDVMRLAYQRYSGARGYTPAEFRAVANEVAGADLGAFFHRALEVPEELDYTAMLDWYGLRFLPAVVDSGAAWLGVSTKVVDGRLVVTEIRRGTPVYGSGIDTDDEIVAVDDVRVGTGGLDEVLARYRAGARVTITVARLHGERRIPVTLGVRPGSRWVLAVRPGATTEQRAHLDAWLHANNPRTP